MQIYRYSPKTSWDENYDPTALWDCSMREVLSLFGDVAKYAVVYWDSMYEDSSVAAYERCVRKLHKHLLAVYRTTETFAYDGGGMMSGMADPYKLAHLLLLDDESEEKLIDLSDNHLFFTDKQLKDLHSPLDDLALFRADGTMILGSCSHEDDAVLYLREEEQKGICLPEDFHLLEGEFWVPSPLTLPVEQLHLPKELRRSTRMPPDWRRG